MAKVRSRQASLHPVPALHEEISSLPRPLVLRTRKATRHQEMKSVLRNGYTGKNTSAALLALLLGSGCSAAGASEPEPSIAVASESDATSTTRSSENAAERATVSENTSQAV